MPPRMRTACTLNCAKSSPRVRRTRLCGRRFAAGVIFAALAVGCSGPGDAPQPGPEPWFELADAGITFTHESGMNGRRTIVEILGPGGAAIDVDSDGDLDLVLRQGAPLDDHAAGPGDRLFVNRLIETGSLSFVDATAGSGLDHSSYGIGAATGDIDGDGRVDLYLANWGPDRLLRNVGGGRFEDITRASGLSQDTSITGASAFVDIDMDGDLDLVVAGYTDFSLARHKDCFALSGALDYCTPLNYAPAPMRLLRNRGDGTFEDASRDLGLGAARANALGVASADVDGNGFPDVFIASDALENHLWMNDGSRLQDEAMLRGVALNGAGMRTGDMGVAFGDVDGNGRLDLVSTHLATEFASLWIDHGNGEFDDRALAFGLGRATGGGTGFGVALLDADLDGWLDLAIVNGDVRTIDAQVRAGDPLPLKQSGYLLHNRQGVSFASVTSERAPALHTPSVGRGLVLADFDNDGDADLLLLANEGDARLLLGTQSARGRWIGFDVRFATGAPALGTALRVRSSDGREWHAHVHVDGSYASARDPRVLLGLGDSRGPYEVQVLPTRGAGSTLTLAAGRYHVIRLGATP